MPNTTEIKFEDGTVIPWPENPTEEDYALLDSIELDITNKKKDVKSALKPQVLKQIEKFGWESVLPTTGALVGTYGGPFAPVTIPAGALFGTYLNQQLGITEKDYLSLIMATAIPGAVKPTQAGLKGTLKRFPGGKEALNEMALDRAMSIPGKYAPTIPSSVLFKKVSSLGVTFKNEKVIRAIDKALREEYKKSNPETEIINYLTNLNEKLVKSPKGLRADDFHKETSDLYTTHRNAFKQGNKSSYHYGNVYNAFKETIDDAAKVPDTSPTALTLKRAIQTYKQESALERIASYLDEAEIVGESTDFHNINGRQVVKKLLKDKNFRGTFPPEAEKDILNIIGEMKSVPKELGLGLRAAIGVGLGIAVPFTASPGMNIAMGAGGYEIVGYSLQSESGRKLMKWLLKKDKGNLSVKSLSVLATYATSQLFQEPTGKGKEVFLSKERGGKLPGQESSKKLKTRIQAEE